MIRLIERTVTTRAVTPRQRTGRAHLEVYPGRADHGRRELVLREAGHEARLPHARVAKEEDADGVVEIVPLGEN